MKILLIGLHSGWMGLHLSHFIRAFQAKNVEVIAADYHRMRRLWGVLKVAGEEERSARMLEKLVRMHQPDAVLFVAQWSFDLQRLRSYYKGMVAVYDYDGPRRRTVADYLSLWDGKIDRFFTVSRWLQHKLEENGKSAVYLPHGVDVDYYAPHAAVPAFSAPVSYIGRTTPRRIELCSCLLPQHPALYGERWSKSPECRANGLASCVRLKRDVRDEELVDIYSSSNAVLNILQEPLDTFQTILSIQCFAVPATAGCLLAEYVEELPEAFEPGREVLAFRTAEELTAWAEKCCREPEFARRIGEAGRKRCIAEHQWLNRVDAFLKSL